MHGEIGRLQNNTRMVARRSQGRVGLEGYVSAGSYDPASYTVSVQEGTTGAIDTTDDENDDAPVVYQNVRLIVLGPLEYGPIGGERVFLFPRIGGGWAAVLEVDTDDTLGTTSGQWKWAHKNPATRIIDVLLQLTNDGQTPGDGLGSFLALVGAYMNLRSAGGLKLIISDLLGYIELGQASLDPVNAAVIRKTDLDAALAAVKSEFQSAINTALAATCASGTGGGPVTLPLVTSTGSSKVKAAN
jgi:hypothetical protein